MPSLFQKIVLNRVQSFQFYHLLPESVQRSQIENHHLHAATTLSVPKWSSFVHLQPKTNNTCEKEMHVKKNTELLFVQTPKLRDKKLLGVSLNFFLYQNRDIQPEFSKTWLPMPATQNLGHFGRRMTKVSMDTQQKPF